MVTQCAQQRGWRATIEMKVEDGSVDVVLERESRRIACEISVTSTVELEMGNLRKCLAAGFTEVYMLCDEAKTLNGLRREAEKGLTAGELRGVKFMNAEELFTDDRLLAEEKAPEEQMVRGYKVKVKREATGAADGEARRRAIGEVLARGRGR